MNYKEISSGLQSAINSIRAHPDCVEDSEFEIMHDQLVNIKHSLEEKRFTEIGKKWRHLSSKDRETAEGKEISKEYKELFSTLAMRANQGLSDSLDLPSSLIQKQEL